MIPAVEDLLVDLRTAKDELKATTDLLNVVPTSAFNSLPDELISHIFDQFVDPRDLVAPSEVSRRLRRLALSPLYAWTQVDSDYGYGSAERCLERCGTRGLSVNLYGIRPDDLVLQTALKACSDWKFLEIDGSPLVESSHNAVQVYERVRWLPLPSLKALVVRLDVTAGVNEMFLQPPTRAPQLSEMDLENAFPVSAPNLHLTALTGTFTTHKVNPNERDKGPGTEDHNLIPILDFLRSDSASSLRTLSLTLQNYRLVPFKTRTPVVNLPSLDTLRISYNIQAYHSRDTREQLLRATPLFVWIKAPNISTLDLSLDINNYSLSRINLTVAQLVQQWLPSTLNRLDCLSIRIHISECLVIGNSWIIPPAILSCSKSLKLCSSLPIRFAADEKTYFSLRLTSMEFRDIYAHGDRRGVCWDQESGESLLNALRSTEAVKTLKNIDFKTFLDPASYHTYLDDAPIELRSLMSVREC